MTVLDRLSTIDEFEQLLTLPENHERLLELINGEVIEVYSLDSDVEILLEGDLLTGSEVLPGFSMPVAAIFVDPLAS